MLTTTTKTTAALADIAGLSVNGAVRITTPPTMAPATAAVVTAMDVAAETANARMTGALTDLTGLRRDLGDDETAALEADAFASYLRTMDLLELAPEQAFSAAQWQDFERAAAQRTRRNALAARRRADELWGAQSVLAATVVGVTLDELLADGDGDHEIRQDLASAGLL